MSKCDCINDCGDDPAIKRGEVQPCESFAKIQAARRDNAAVDLFAGAMRLKMAASRAKGRGGWHDPAQCPPERLAEMLIAHIAKGDPVDVGNFAMMIFNRPDALGVLSRAAPPAPVSRADGWQLAPVEPTHRMLIAARRPGSHAERYRAMLAAAPQTTPIANADRVGMSPIVMQIAPLHNASTYEPVICELPQSEETECSECHGKGSVDATHEPLRDGYTETFGECCDRCQGTGKIAVQSDPLTNEGGKGEGVASEAPEGYVLAPVEPTYEILEVIALCRDVLRVDSLTTWKRVIATMRASKENGNG